MDVTIGEFSRMTHLTVKTLRHYHRVGLLEPVGVDPRTGYRYYSTDQVPAAQVIRRFRALDMPIDEVRAVLNAPDEIARTRLITDHLDRLQAQLEHTRSAVESLRSLLEPPAVPEAVGRRSAPPMEAIAISATVDHEEVGAWWSSGFLELRALADQLGWAPTGPAGGLYAHELFEDERGEATLYLPVAGASSDLLPVGGRARTVVVPGADLAVLVHRGSEDSIDLTYGALGTYVAEQALGAPGPIRETYLVDASTTENTERWRTEVGWPIVTEGALDAR